MEAKGSKIDWKKMAASDSNNYDICTLDTVTSEITHANEFK